MIDEKVLKAPKARPPVEEPQKTPLEPTAVDFLELAAEVLEKQQGPRANKFYRRLAAEARRLAERAAG